MLPYIKVSFMVLINLFANTKFLSLLLIFFSAKWRYLRWKQAWMELKEDGQINK